MSPAAFSSSVDPTVSVIMPCWNREQYIGEAIESVLAQSYTDFELIVVDDGSTDASRERVGSFDDPRLHLVAIEHQGISAAMNAGLVAARGRLIARLDSDDWWLPEMLETQVAVLEARPEIGLVYAKGECTDSAGNSLEMTWGYPLRYPDQTFRSMVYNDSTCNITVVCRRECFERVGNFDESLQTSEDLDMWLRVARHFDFAFTDQVLARIRLHGTSITGEVSTGRDEQMERRGLVFQKLFATPDLPPEISALEGHVFSNLHTSNGLLWLGHGKFRKGLSAFGQAVRVSPRPTVTCFRIIWSTIKWHVLPRLPGGRRLCAWIDRTLSRLRG